MGRQGGHGAAADAVVNGVLTGGWYALPDVVASRRARGSLKVAVIVGGAAWAAARAVRAAQAADGDTADAAAEGGGDAPAAESVPTTLVARMATEPAIDAQALALGGNPPNGVRPVRIAAGVALVVLSVVGTVAGERAIYRWGERLTARGVRYAHTRIGLAAGGVIGLSTWALARD
ncbi:hypothetical protein M3148_02655 [Georgenia satyanarayanai]|uniref:hypothetical protein n=1 Tax=Georgenia satyanarayanai TaxID=860221 RepID=UPI00203D4CB1|nr:hypothetical protein [Georgenia satyanarayanai]MCM3659901.1 hypothetical protein [Georgenia satyanarayanai]